MLRRIRGNSSDKFYQDLMNKEPHVVSLTFWRDDSNLPDKPPPQRLGIKIDKVKSQEDEGDRSSGDYQISALDDNPESLLFGMPIEVGDLLVAVNSQSCYGLDIDLLKQMVATQTGIVTLTLRKTRMASFQDELRLAVFIDSQQHTCIPMDICFFKEPEKLAIFSLYDQFDADTNRSDGGDDNINEWLESSCLAEGQVVLDINGTPSFQLLEEEALAVMNECLEADEVLAIKTYAPSRASTSETVDMVERMSSYIVQLQLRMDRCLAQARNDSNTLDYKTTAPFPIFQSATKLEKAFLGSYNRCVSVTTVKALYRLYLVMEDVWTKYARVLSRKFPPDNRFTKVLRKRLPANSSASMEHQQQNQQQKQQKGWFPKQQDQLNNQAPAEEDDDEVSNQEKDEAQKEQAPAAGRGWFFSRKQESNAPTESIIEEAPSARSRWFFSRRQPQESDTAAAAEDPDSSNAAPGWFRSGKKQDTEVKDVDPQDKEATSRMAICHVLCTGDYCIKHLEEQEAKLKEVIDQKFKLQIDFDDTKQAFLEEVIDKGIPQLVHSVEFQLEPILMGMTRLKWHLWEEVGDTSPYATEMIDLLKKRVTLLAIQLPPKIHQRFNFDLVEAVCEAYYFTLIKVHRISPVGTQQLLLDVCTFKTEFVSLLQISGQADSIEKEDSSVPEGVDGRMKDPQGYVNELLKKTEALLKLAGTNVGVDDLLVEMDKKAESSRPVANEKAINCGDETAGTSNEAYSDAEEMEKPGDTCNSQPDANAGDTAESAAVDRDDDDSVIVFDSSGSSDIPDSERQLWQNKGLADVI